MARGGPRLPPRNAVRGGSLRRLPFPLAPRLGHEPRACRPPALGGGNLRNQSAHQRWDPDVTFLSANARHPMLGAVRQWRAWARGRRGGRARLDRMRPGSWMALLRPRAGDAVTGTPGPARHSFHSATHLHLAGGPAGGRAPAVATVLPRPARPAVADGPRARSLRAVTPVRRVTDDLVTRVAGAHRRVELPARGAAVMRERAGVAAAVEHALTARQRPAGAPAEQPSGGTAWPAVGSLGRLPPLDLDHLTDQIVTRLDNRLTAHRERFGRA